MSTSIGEKYVSELTELFQAQGTHLYNGQHSLCLTTACVNYIQRKLTALRDNPSVLNRSFNLSDIEYICDCLCKIKSLKLISDRKQTVAPSLVILDLSLFNALQSLILKRVPVSSLTNLQKLREQLCVLVINRSNINKLEDVLISCGGDQARAFAWSNLRELDLSVNSIKCIGESMRYLPELEHVNFSSNQIGPAEIEGDSSSTSLTSVDRDEGLLSVCGIQYIDKVKTLRLGFNQLVCVPEFGTRAKFNLTVLILRNNLLKDVIGIEMLDSLVELDVCENLISKHTSLYPLLNLHHLNVLLIEGNPICYDPKYRLKIMKCLSNLISQSTLNGKKLSSHEKKGLSQSLTRYSPPTTPISTPAPSPSPLHAANRTVLLATPPPVTVISTAAVPEATNEIFDDISIKQNSLPSVPTTQLPNNKPTKKISTKKKPRIVAFEDDSAITQSTSLGSNNGIPLLNQERLNQREDMRNLLKENWLSTVEPAYSGQTDKNKPHSLDTPTNNYNTLTNGPSTVNGIDSHTETHDSTPPTSTPINLTNILYSDATIEPDIENCVFPMEYDTRSSPINKGPTPQVTGNIFDVSIFESDTDEERFNDTSVWISISDRFLQEIHTDIVQDQLDLNRLKSAVIEERFCKGRKKEVLVLQFSYDRRDRRKREYILNDTTEQQQILEQLIPIVEANNSAVSISTKLECFKCQIVIDWLEALDAPFDSPAAASVGSYSFETNKRQFGKLCPYCNGFLIQIGSTNVPQSCSSHKENGLLSPGHIDISTFANYPESTVDSEELYYSKPPRLSPIPPSPYPDMGPFHKSNDVTGDSMETSNIETESTTNAVAARTCLMSNSMSPVITEDNRQSTFGQNSNSQNLLYRSLNPFDTAPALVNSLTEQESSLLASHEVRNTKTASINPFDELVDDHETVPEERHHKRVSKSLSGTHTGAPAVGTVTTKCLSISKLPTKDQTSVDNYSISTGSVPTESKLRSYFSNLMGSNKVKKEDTGGKSGHTRSSSQDYRVKPLPDTMKDRSIDRPTPATVTAVSQENHHKNSSDASSSSRSSRTDSELQAGSEKKTSGSGSDGKRFGKFSVTINRRKSSRKQGSSSETEDNKPFTAVTVLPYKEDDPTYIHNSFSLYLNMEVFTRSEKFELAMKCPIIEYGDWNEIESLIVVSNRTAYIFHVTAPECLSPENWLELCSKLLLKELVYIEIGIGYQTLRLEFDQPPRCHTLLIRNEDKCRKFFDKLSYVVSDVPKSNFKGLRINQFSLMHLKNPHRALREIIFSHYDQFQLSTDNNDQDEIEQLKLYVLGHKYNPHNEPAQVAVTLALTNLHVFLALDNPQWPLPKLHPLPDRSDLLPPYSGVVQKDITDVEKLILFEDQVCQFTLQFFNENTSNEDPTSWTIVLKTSKSLQKFIKILENLWFEQFQQTLQKEFR